MPQSKHPPVIRNETDMKRLLVFMPLLLFILALAVAFAEDTWAGHFVFSPESDVYPRYIADPVRPGFSLMRLYMKDGEIPETGDDRYIFSLGGRYGFFRIYAPYFLNSRFQLDIEGAFLGQFDIDNSLDNIGWDGLYGVLLTWGAGDTMAFKLSAQHDSSHVGDEYMERTGRPRLNYTREEFVFGTRAGFKSGVNVYGEIGYGHDLRNKEYQAPWRIQAGIEFEVSDLFLDGRCGLFAALDAESFEESDWRKDVTIRTGFTAPVGWLGRVYRIGVEYRNGRPVIGEFFRNQESYYAAGLWMEL